MNKLLKILILLSTLTLSSCSTNNTQHIGLFDFDSRSQEQIKANNPYQKDVPSAITEKSWWKQILDLANMNVRIRILYVDYNDCSTNSITIGKDKELK